MEPVGNPASRGPPDLAQIGKPANKNYGNDYGNCGPQDHDQISKPENKNFLTLELEVKGPFKFYLTPHQADIAVYKSKHG